MMSIYMFSLFPVPSITTSLWLSSPSSSPFTCQTAETNRAAAVEWPDILYRESHKIWLGIKEEEEEEREIEEKGEGIFFLSFGNTLLFKTQKKG